MAWCLWHQRLFHKWQHESQVPATHAAIYEINVDATNTKPLCGTV